MVDTPSSSTAAPQPAPGLSPILVAGSMLCVAGALMLIWRGSLDGSFQFDDYGGIVNNPAITSLWNWPALRESNRPFGNWTFAANYAAGGLDPTGYHVVNLVIHVLNAVLLTLGVLLAGLVGTVEQAASRRLLLVAMGCGLLWGVNPLTTQSVTYIVQRFESLAAFGYLLAWVSLLLVALGHRWANLLTLVAAWIGLLSKETMATAPLTLLLFDRIWLATSWKEILHRRWATYLLLLTPWVWFLPSVARWFDVERHTSMGFGLQSVTPWQYLRTQPEILLRYLRLVAWPSDLTFDYGWWVQTDPRIYLSGGALIVAALIAGAVLAWKRRLAGFLILSFFLILAPTSSLMPIADLAVEHRMYLPSAIVLVSLVLAGGWCVDRLATARPRLQKIAQGAAFAGLGLAISAAGWRTHLRNQDYRDGLTLWTKNLEVRPQNARAYYMLGTEWHGRGDYQQAFEQFSLARDRWRGAQSALVHVGLGDCYREFGEDDKALASYRFAIRLGHPASLGQAHNGTGVILHRRGQLAEARQSFEAAREHKLPEADYNLAAVLIEMKREAEAVPILERMLEEHPGFTRAPRRLAWILSTSPETGLRDGKRAVKLIEDFCRPDESQSPYVWDTLAAAYAEVGDFAVAARAATRAESLASSLPSKSLTEAIRHRRSIYLAKQPYRDVAPAGSETAIPGSLSGGETEPASTDLRGGRS